MQSKNDRSNANLEKLSIFDRNALLIFGSLLIIYLITFNGQFTSIDELNLYSMMESLVQTGTTAVPQVYFAAFHNPVGSHEVGFPLVATPLYWFSVQTDALNNIYFVMLLNPLLVAATSAFIYLTARRLNYSPVGSTVAALAYGLGSLGWPYALGFYREPLVGFLWIIGIYGLISWRETGSKWFAVIGTLAILLSPLVKVNILFSIPFLFLVAFKDGLSWKKRTYILIAVGIVGLFILFQLLYIWRIGNGLDYLHILSGIRVNRILLRIYGLLASPIKGLIFYMPVIILFIPGIYCLYRKYRFVALGILLSFLSLVAVLSIYSAWYGGQSWGPRMLVPIIPIVMIPIASLWDAAKKKSHRSLIIIVLLISILIQLPVVTSNWWGGYVPFFELDPSPEESIGLSFRHLALSPPWVLLTNWQLQDLNLLWFHTDRSGTWHHVWWLGGILLVCLFTILLIRRISKFRNNNVLLLVPVIAAILVLQLGGRGISSGYPGLTKEAGQVIAKSAEVVDSEPYTLVTMSNEFHIYFFEGFLKGNFVHHWYSPNQLEGFEDILDNVKGEWLSLVIDRVHMEPGYTGEELSAWLNKHFYQFGGDWIDGYEIKRYALFPSESWSWQNVQHTFGPLLIDEFAINTKHLSTQDVLGVQIRVCYEGEEPDTHQIFLHLLGADGTIEGLDGPIQNDPNIELQKGDCVIEKRGIYVPPDSQSGSYQLIFGVYTSDGIIVPEGADDSVTYQILTTVDILNEDQ